MNFKKVAVSFLAAGLTLGWAALPVFGSAEAIVDGVSDDSVGTATAYDDDTLLVENLNFGFVDSFTFSLGDTGENSISGDDGNSIGTGGAGAGALSENFLDTNETEVSGGGASAHATVMNITEESTGSAYAQDNDSLGILNGNCWEDGIPELFEWLFSDGECGIQSGTLAIADSGDNDISGEDDNSVSTGPADAEAMSVNAMNTNQTTVSGWGNSAFATVDGVSDDSVGTATAYDDDELMVANWNFGFIDSWTKAKAETGENSISGDDRNSIETGGATAGAFSANFLNTNETTVGGEGETAEATVSDVSEESTGSAYASDNDSVSVENGNLGFVDSTTKAKADSGENSISGEDDNSITTGDASAESSSTNVVNTNVTTIEF